MPLKRAMQASQGNPATGGKFTYAQLQGIWIKYGGDPTVAPMAAAIAMAESGGDANSEGHNTNGTIDRGLWQINSIWGSKSTKDIGGNTRAAVEISKNGTDWGPWSTFHNGAYKKFLNVHQGAVSPGDTSGGSSATGSGGGGGGVTSILDLLTAPVDTIGGWIAGIALNVVKDVGEGIADYIIRPAWHWNQRAAIQYQTSMFADKTGKQVLWTAVFWGGGYWLLFTDPNEKGFGPAPARNSRLARHARFAQSIPARQSLVKPKDVKKKTPKKPKPVSSRAVVTQTGTMATTRTQRVKVTGDHARFANGSDGRNGTESAERVERAGTVPTTHRDATRVKPTVPHAKHGTGTRSLPDSGRGTEGDSTQSSGIRN